MATETEKADLKGTKVLFLAYFYPPVNSQEIPGAMRTIKFIRNVRNGDCHVLTTPPRTAPNQSALNHLSLPINSESIHRIKPWDIFTALLTARSLVKKPLEKRKGNHSDSPSAALQTSGTVFKGIETEGQGNVSAFQKFKDFIYNLCYFPDQAGPWLLPAYFSGKDLVKKKNVEVIFATGSPWTSLWLGYKISKSTGVPLIADFRDPWMNNPFHQSKGALLDSWSKKLEKKVVEYASKVSLNTEALRDDFLVRYPSINPEKFCVLPNGFDESDFSNSEKQTKESQWITLAHAGFLYGVRDPSVLLNAIRMANQLLGSSAKKLRFHQMGDLSLNFDLIAKYADMLEDGSLVVDTPKPYDECLKFLSTSEWLVNIQPSTKTQVPSKLYDYLALNKPILNITPKDGALGTLVQKHGLGEIFSFDEENALTDKLTEIASHRANESFQGYASRDLFKCSVISQKLVDIILDNKSKNTAP